MITEMTLDALDIRLVNALGRDGRATITSLADTVDASASTVANRLDRLAADGVIRGFGPRLDYAALGFPVTAIVQLRIRGSALPELADWLADRPQVVAVYEVTGRYNVVIVGKFRDTGDMHDRLSTILRDPDVVEDATCVALSVVSEDGPFEVPPEPD